MHLAVRRIRVKVAWMRAQPQDVILQHAAAHTEHLKRELFASCFLLAGLDGPLVIFNHRHYGDVSQEPGRLNP